MSQITPSSPMYITPHHQCTSPPYSSFLLPHESDHTLISLISRVSITNSTPPLLRWTLSITSLPIFKCHSYFQLPTMLEITHTIIANSLSTSSQCWYTGGNFTHNTYHMLHQFDKLTTLSDHIIPNQPASTTPIANSLSTSSQCWFTGGNCTHNTSLLMGIAPTTHLSFLPSTPLNLQTTH